METFKIVILSLSALMLIGVGAMRLGNPIKTFAKSSGIKLANDVDLLNEIRGISALMLTSGVIIALGTFISKIMLTSFMVAVLIYFGFALGRLISIKADGKPNKQIIQGIGFEIVFGSLNLIGLVSCL